LLTSNWKICNDHKTTPLGTNEPTNKPTKERKTLDTLPYELIGNIAGRLEHKDIKSLVLTSRKFRSVVQTFLYQNLSSNEIEAVVRLGNHALFGSVVQYPQDMTFRWDLTRSLRSYPLLPYIAYLPSGDRCEMVRHLLASPNIDPDEWELLFCAGRHQRSTTMVTLFEEAGIKVQRTETAAEVQPDDQHFVLMWGTLIYRPRK
jgi:hypothetical protein